MCAGNYSYKNVLFVRELYIYIRFLQVEYFKFGSFECLISNISSNF